MIFLSLSIILLMLGPFFYFTAERWPSGFRLFQKLITISMIFVIIFHILPETMRKIPWPLWSLFIIGWLLPYLIETSQVRFGKASHSFALVLGLIGMFIHTFLDGVTLALLQISQDFGQNPQFIQFFISIHRIPESLFVCLLIQPRYGLSTSLYLLAGLAVATLIGYTATDFWMGDAFSQTSPYLYSGQALGIGALFHLLTHSHSACKTKAALCTHEPCHHDS